MKQKKRINKDIVLNYVAAFSLFSAIPAVYVWHTVFDTLLIALASLITVLDISKHGVNKKQLLTGAFFAFILFIFILRSETNIYGSIEVSLVIPFVFARKEFLKSLFSSFVKIFAFFMVLSIPVYVLACLIGISLPFWTIEPLNELKFFDYHLYPFMITQESSYSDTSFRFYGLFDEPGVVGTISAILLMADKFDLRKWENVVILLSGVLSLSFFFFIVCAVYILLAAPMKFKLITIIVVVIFVAVLYDNEILYQILFYRFNVEDGVVEGMNREHGDFDIFYEKFRQTSDYWFGLGNGVGAKVNEGGSSYKQIVVDYGMLFFASYILSFYIYAINATRGLKNLFIFSLFFLGTMYQRPFIGTATMTFLMVASIYVISNNYLQNKKNERKYSINNSSFV